MDAIERHILAYRSAPFDSNGEAWGKTEALKALEDLLPDDRVLNFFLDLIADPDEYDMARVEALKVLQLWGPPSEQSRGRVGRRLSEVFLAEPDVLVQQWMAIAAENFIGLPEVFEVASMLLADPEADLDVRHNCLAAVQRLGRSDRVVGVLKPLTSDPQLGVHVRRILKEWDG